ncbi:uncharacterized protein [Miscanthus floridulus]|uniref:uncharacterized protein n=1 Tax=Miscanthus floridulus TaxID=154761 RepID=UPI00345968B5
MICLCFMLFIHQVHSDASYEQQHKSLIHWAFFQQIHQIGYLHWLLLGIQTRKQSSLTDVETPRAVCFYLSHPFSSPARPLQDQMIRCPWHDKEFCKLRNDHVPQEIQSEAKYLNYFIS